MKIFMYRTSGGKDLLKKISREVKPVVLTILLGLQEDVVKNSEYMSEIHGEFQKIVDAVMDNKEIVDELEQIIGQFKI